MREAQRPTLRDEGDLKPRAGMSAWVRWRPRTREAWEDGGLGRGRPGEMEA